MANRLCRPEFARTQGCELFGLRHAHRTIAPAAGPAYNAGVMARKTKTVTPEEAQAARKKVRDALFRFLRTPDLRKKIRRRNALVAILFVLQFPVLYFVARPVFYGWLPFAAHKIPLMPRLLPEKTRLILCAMAAGIQDSPEALTYIDRAEQIARSPYTCYVRAAVLADLRKDIGHDKAAKDGRAKLVQESLDTLRTGAQLDPENLFWPICEANRMAADGDVDRAVDELIRGCSQRAFYRYPEPEEPCRDLMLTADAMWLWLHAIKAGPSPDLFAAASNRAGKGDFGAAAALDRIVDAILREFATTEDVFRRSPLAVVRQTATRNHAFLATRTLDALTRGSSEIAKTRAQCRVAGVPNDRFIESAMLALLFAFVCFLLLPCAVYSTIKLVVAGIRPLTALTSIAALAGAEYFFLGTAALLFAALAIIATISQGGGFLVVVWGTVAVQGLRWLLRYRKERIPIPLEAYRDRGTPWNWRRIRIAMARAEMSLLFVSALMALLLSGFLFDYAIARGMVTPESVWLSIAHPATSQRTMRVRAWEKYDARYGKLDAAMCGERDPDKLRAAAKEAGVELRPDLGPQAHRQFEERCLELRTQKEK